MKASVIIPAYNARERIEKTVRSIADPKISFPYEILVINDGSTDDTLSCLNRLAKEILPLRVLTQENAGPAAARNFGIQEARGEYILFCDSDDLFTEGALEKAVSLCEKERADLLLFGFYLVQDGEKHPYCYSDCRLQSPEDYQKHLIPLYRQNMLNQVWAKVFSAALLKENNIRFPLEFWGEDRLFFFEALKFSRTVSVSSACLYEYIQHPNSLISRFLLQKPEICGRIDERIRALVSDKCGNATPEANAVLSYMYVKSLLSCMPALFSPGCPLSFKEKRDYVKKIRAQQGLSRATSFPADCGKSFAILSSLLKNGGTDVNLLAALGVHAASRLAPRLFRKAKHTYNKEQKGK